MSDYRCEARNIPAFISQIVRYVASGHYFYVRVLIPESKDVRAVDAKLLARYGVERKTWQRKRRNLKKTAGIHYLRFDRCAVLMLTKGNHDVFYADHGSSFMDVRRRNLKVFGYSIAGPRRERPKVSVSLDDETYRQMKGHFLAIGVWDSYRDPERLGREFQRLPYQPYGPVFKQQLAVLRAVNSHRRRRGFEPVDFGCLRNKLKLGRVFESDERTGNEEVATV